MEFISLANVPLCHCKIMLSWPVSCSHLAFVHYSTTYMIKASFWNRKNYRSLLPGALDWLYTFSEMKRGNKPPKPPIHTRRIICTLWSMCLPCGPLQVLKYSYSLLCQMDMWNCLSGISVIIPDTFKFPNPYIYIFFPFFPPFFRSSSLHSATCKASSILTVNFSFWSYPFIPCCCNGMVFLHLTFGLTA